MPATDTDLPAGSELDGLDLARTSTARAPILDWAASGAMLLTGARSGPPQLAPFGAGTVVSVALAALADLTARRTGETPSLPAATLLGERAAIAGFRRNAPWSAGGSTRAVPADDGWWVLSLPRESDRSSVGALVESAAVAEPWAAVDAWAAGGSAADAVERAQLLGLAAAVVPANATALDPQRAHRGDVPVVVSRGGPRRPSSRPRVIDLTSLWAGPLCAALLGTGGCDVIKVESTSRLDGARSGPSSFYDLLHSGHRSVTVDFGSTDGRDQLKALVASADVVLEASRPRALAQLGVSAAEAIDAGTTWVSLTAYGRTGPWANRVGFGDDVAVGSGLHAVVDGRPTPCGDAIADPLTGVYAAAATAAALLSPHALLLDISMREVAALAARVRDEPGDVTGSDADGWSVEWAGGRAAVAAPTRRAAPGPAARAGADNAALLGRALSG